MDSSEYSSTRGKIRQSKLKSSAKKTLQGSKKASGDCGTVSTSTSHSQFYTKKKLTDSYQRITRDEYYGTEYSEESSETFGCVDGPEGKQYSDSENLKRAFTHNLDPVSVDQTVTDSCPLQGWEIVEKLEFLIRGASPLQQLTRLTSLLRDFAKVSGQGFVQKVDVLDEVCVVLDFLADTYLKEASLREPFILLLNNIHQPIRLHYEADIVTYFHNLSNYMGFIGCLLLRLEEDSLFDIVSKALLWQLSAPDSMKPPTGTLRREPALLVAAPALYHTAVRMLAVTTSYRFPTFLQMALLLACASRENCIEMMKQNILENIFYRFNPYFPERKLPAYDTNPADPQDCNVRLGASSMNMTTTLSLLLVLAQALTQCSIENPQFVERLSAPDDYSLRCFMWAYKYECRARGHQTERITLSVIMSALVRCFGERMQAFASVVMLDMLSLSVATELPTRADWTGSVNFNISQSDVYFKKVLINLSVDFIKAFPHNKNLVESRHWVVGLMCLLDPGLKQLRKKWSQPHYDELKLAALQALVCTLPHLPGHVAKDCGLIKRMMWHIEWYTTHPYELPVLYWCVRLLQVASRRSAVPPVVAAIKDLFDSHGVIILMNLCSTLVSEPIPPVEKRQVILSLCLRLLTRATAVKTRITCHVYPSLVWPVSINHLARNMLNTVVELLMKGYIISERWLVSLLNFIWEGIIWRDEYRKSFIANNGVYMLLDFISMTRPSVQCLALAVLCDAASTGSAIAQLVTWRASAGASKAYPRVVKAGSTIATLLASVFRDECQRTGVRLDENGIIMDSCHPLRTASAELVKSSTTVHYKNPICLAAADLAGSRMSKAFAILQMLTKDLNDKTMVADEAYNLYKHIQLRTKDEIILVLCSHYLTLKLMETWSEIHIQNEYLESHDADIVEEFLNVSKGWTIEIKRQQEAVAERHRKKNQDSEDSLYDFLARVRVNTALDALREVRREARTGDRALLTISMVADAVHAHHRRIYMASKLGHIILRTYKPPLDQQNIIGQYVKSNCNPEKTCTCLDTGKYCS